MVNENYLNPRDIDFYLYEFLDTEALLERPRYADHSREIFDATLNGAQDIAKKYFANHYAKGDDNEPTFDGLSVTMIPETQVAWNVAAEFGLMAAHHDASEGGLQLPEIICKAAGAYIQAANCASSGYYIVTASAGNLVRNFGSKRQKEHFLHPMMDGRFAGTMALSEPAQGSALADITTSAKLQSDGSYRIRGQKIYITNGDHNLTENIIHMVLAKIEGAPPGVKGISLFIVPKVLVNEDGSLGQRNDVALAGLLHKMGNRTATSTVLHFGEREGAVGYLVGEPHQGLRYMFQMMNELRVGVGLGAAAIAYRGYQHSLQYARERPQGRLPSNKNPLTPQVKIIQHADVRRMLMAQKAIAEGSMALTLYAASLFEDSQTLPHASDRERAHSLLDLLTPVVKSFPARYGCVSNDLAIQVLGGSGYIRDYPVEQLYRDQRLNPIHEGTDGIHGIDLLGRKVSARRGDNFQLLMAEIRASLVDGANIRRVEHLIPPINEALDRVEHVTANLLERITADPDRGLSNASLYLNMFGHLVVAWIWFRQAVVAAKKLSFDVDECSEIDANFYHGKLQTARYFIKRELPKTSHEAKILGENDSICFDMQETFF